MTSTLLLGYDGSPGARDALAWTAAEAERRHSAVRVVHAHRGDAAGGEQVLKEALTELGHLAPSVEATGVVSDQGASAALLAEAEGVDLLVVGSRGHGGFTGLVLGSVSHQCTHHATCPVVVVRGPDSDGPVVVGVDGSEGSNRAADWAAAEAERRHVALRVVHAWQYPPIGAYVVTPPEGWDQLSADLVEQSLVALRKAHPTLEMAGESRFAANVDALLAASQEASMLVVGARGHGGFSGMLLGSTGQGIVHYAHRPVVVVR